MDPVSKVAAWLTNDWNNDNTDSVTPLVGEIYDYKRIKQLTEDKDVILIYARNELEDRDSVGYYTVRKKWNISIDVRTVKSSHDHLLNMKDEVLRILHSKRKDSTDSDFNYLKVTRNEDMSNRMKKLFRRVIDVEFTLHGEDIS